MPTIHLEAEVTRESLLKAVDQLNATELDQFVTDVLHLRARRRPDRLTSSESELLSKINDGLPDAMRARYTELIARRQQEQLTPEEHEELIVLTDSVEHREVERLAALAELAGSQGVTLPVVMERLGIPAPSDG